jgi:phytanoyl-CoA dioxygenase PhyH
MRGPVHNLLSVVRTFVKYPGFVLMRSVARFGGVRHAAAWAQSALREPVGKYIARLRQHPSQFFENTDAAELARTVERDGFARGLTLPAPVVDELVDFAQCNQCWADRDPQLGFLPERIEEARRKVGRRFLLAHYFNARRRSALIGRLTEDPLLLEVAARYLRTVPKLVGVTLWWSYPTESDAISRSRAAQMFHFDLDDFKFIKFFFYLTDVDASAGPHVIVRGTHRDKPRLRRRDAFKVRRYSDDEIVAAYGRDRIVSITGPAGTGFVEDTLCIHKGEPPTGRPRLVLQVQYALNDFGNQCDDIDEAKLRMIV